MRSFIATALALASVASAATNSTASGTAVGSVFAQGYDESCQAYYTECSNASGRCQSGLDDCNAKCQTAYNDCRIGADANMATCAANYAGCLGTNPFDSNGSLTNGTTATNGTGTDAGALGAAGGVSVTTEVVTSFTTFCPFATQVTYNGQVYTVTSATVLTITNCPCTITKAVTAGTATATGSVATSAKASATGSSGNGSYTPEAFTGAGSKGLVLAGSGLIAGVAGLAIFL